MANFVKEEPVKVPELHTCASCNCLVDHGQFFDMMDKYVCDYCLCIDHGKNQLVSIAKMLNMFESRLET